MRFQLAHKLCTYLLVLSALAAVACTGALSPITAGLLLAACLLSLPVDPGNKFAAVMDRIAPAARAVAGAAVAAMVWRIWRRLPDPDIGPVLDLVIAPLGYKLFYRRTHRDHVHISALTFLLVLVASTLAGTFLFMAALAVYVVLAVWALILFHLRREMEENYLVKHSTAAPSQKVGVARILSSRRVVGRGFFVGTGLMAVGAFAGGVAIFVLVPRVGAGFVLGTGGLPTAGLGFGDEVTLGRYGTGKAARHAVVLRAKVASMPAGATKPVDAPAAAEPTETTAARAERIERMYFRGAAYDSYEHGRWVRSRRPELRTVVEHDAATNRAWVHELDESASVRSLAGTERQEIEAVGIPASVLFALDRTVAIDLPSPRLGAAGTLRVTPRWSGEVGLRIGESDGFITLAHAHYVAYAQAESENHSGRPQQGLTTAARGAYLALPPAFAPRLQAVAQKVDAGLEMSDKITAITRWLRSGHSYTSEPPPAPRDVDPIEDFLFNQTTGHCEYFASAAVLLLRAGGVPARYVTGFRGGDWSNLGGYVAIRDDRAHAWAEAFLPDQGWVRVDATPPGEGPRAASRAAELTDALDYWWNRWVVGYDLGRQRDLAQRAARRLAPGGLAALATRVGRVAPEVGGIGLALALMGVALGFASRRIRWRPGFIATLAGAAQRRKAQPDSAIDRLYRLTLVRLAQAGHARRPNETPHEYAERVRAAGFHPTGEFDDLTTNYTAARFGGRAISDNAVAALAAKMASGASPAGQPGTAAKS
jgi:transglutaminase-like putative cysteine protease